MLPLAAETTPTTTDELIAALRRGLDQLGLTARDISGEGAGYPQLANLRIDLSGAQFTRENRPTDVAGGDGGEVSIGHFELFGEPLYFEKTAVEARIEANGVRLRVVGTPQDGRLNLEGAKEGSASVKVTIGALEALLQTVASEAASKQGIEVKKTKLTLKQEGPRAVTFRAEVTAKVFVMSATLALTGRLDIDDAFNARLSTLALDGDAMVTNLAGSFLRPRLQQLEGRGFPLLAFSPGGLKLRDIQVAVTPALQLSAQFGEA